ncbi:hypothetical protein Hamer_G025407 [Homarus americanus]|uniref:Uncharacterized protein n=1 Tax=Homarus americanus TaxID=6706 RepID=A0A8J5N7H6_HOMAM|nr:hypothetical protein Hamer_G025407 [Homarus americanus]
MISTLPQAVVVDPCPEFNVSAYLKTLDDIHEENLMSDSNLRTEFPQDSDKNIIRIDNDNKICTSIPIIDLTNMKENYSRKNGNYSKLREKLMPNRNLQETPTSDKLSATSQDMKSHRGSKYLLEEFQPLVVLVAGLRPVKVQ